jgi:hypothetical protein
MIAGVILAVAIIGVILVFTLGIGNSISGTYQSDMRPDSYMSFTAKITSKQMQ